MQYHSGHYYRELADKLEIVPGSVLTGVSFALVEGGSLTGKVRSRYHNSPLGGVSVIPQEISKESPSLHRRPKPIHTVSTR